MQNYTEWTQAYRQVDIMEFFFSVLKEYITGEIN